MYKNIRLLIAMSVALSLFACGHTKEPAVAKTIQSPTERQRLIEISETKAIVIPELPGWNVEMAKGHAVLFGNVEHDAFMEIRLYPTEYLHSATATCGAILVQVLGPISQGMKPILHLNQMHLTTWIAAFFQAALTDSLTITDLATSPNDMSCSINLVEGSERRSPELKHLNGVILTKTLAGMPEMTAVVFGGWPPEKHSIMSKDFSKFTTGVKAIDLPPKAP